MRKRLPIKDSVGYSLDKVNCFERAIVNQLNYKNKYYGNLFIMLSKLYEFYFLQSNVNSREEIISLSENILNCKCQRIHKIKFSIIKKFIDEGYLPILGGNLFSLFYSDHYKEDDWPHWFVMTGYDIERKLYYIFDDMQYTHIDCLYGDICLTDKIIKTINRKYISVYDKKWCCFVLEIIAEIPLNEALRNILQLYFKFEVSDKNAYPQVMLLKELYEINKNKDISSNMFEELKKKILNMNKYRTIFVYEIEKFMHKLNYDNDSSRLLKKCNKKLEKLWDVYVSSNILRIIKDEEIKLKISDEMVYIENDIKNILLDFSQFLLLESEKNNYKAKSTFENLDYGLYTENDVDKIILLSKNEIVFNFNKGKIYNWWFEDHAPKVILSQSVNPNRDFKVFAKIKIDKEFTQKNFQAGIFLRTESDSLFCALDAGGLFVLDEIGKINKSSHFIYSNSVEITVEKKDKMLFTQIKDCKSNESKIEWYINSDKYIDVGFACKTWGEIGNIGIKFYDYFMEFK